MEESKIIENNTKVSKQRRIKYTHSNDWGIIFTEKNTVDNNVEFESILEESFYHLVIHDPNVIEVESQPFKILHPETNKSVYPDAYVKFSDGTEIVYEIKYKAFLDSLKNNPDEKRKFENKIDCISKFCKNNGYKFRVITDNEILKTRFENVNFYLKNERTPSLFSNIIPLLNEIFTKKKSIKKIELTHEIGKKLNIDYKLVVSTIDHLIYHDYFLLDFNQKVDDETILEIKGKNDTIIEPIYKYFDRLIAERTNQQMISEPKFIPSQKDPNKDIKKEDFDSLSPRIQKKILNKIKMLKIFDRDNLTTDILDEFAKNNNISRTSLYNWKKVFDQYGWRGLLPQNKNAGRKSDYEPKVWDIAQNVIDEKYYLKTKPSIKACYNLFVERCLDVKLKIFSYSTFKNYVNSNSQAKKVRMRYGIKKERDNFKPIGLFGAYPFGNFPLDGVEFDHSELDIALVDREERKPIGDHPILTLAVDVYSRMIYGYYLSLDHQSILTVGMCLLSGILPKDDITDKQKTMNKWNICGIPKSIILDNAKEFISPQLNSFLDRHKITKRFDPVKIPDYKPFVERMIRTINEAIKNDFIKGYRIPLKDKRDTDYDNEKMAEMTFEEFEKWFIHWIVDEYHQRIHGGLKKIEGIEITPQDRYESGIENVNGRTVGLSDIPEDWKQLRYGLLPFTERTLRREGISFERLQYNHPIIKKIRSRDIKSKQNRKKYIIKYDARDLRELYLWDDIDKQYYEIPLRNIYFIDLKINPLDNNSYPLSLEELKAIKKIQQNKSPLTSKSPISEYQLIEARKRRREIIEDAQKKTRTAKKARKQKEKSEINKEKATSTQIRSQIKDLKQNDSEENESEKIDVEEIKKKLRKNKFPTEQFPKKIKRGRY